MRDFLLEMLSIIDYQGNKEEYVNKALSSTFLNSITSLISASDQATQAKINSELSAAKSPEDIENVATKFFSKEDVDQQLEKSSQEFISDYLENVYPTLSVEQQKTLEDYLNARTISQV